MERAYIGMGANIASPAGPPESTLAEAARQLGRLGQIVCQSSLYSTRPVGVVDQPRFVNAVIGLETQLGPRELLNELLRIEVAFGRDRSHGLRNGPRPLDLDLLLWGNEQIHEPGLDVPHPRMHERMFVMAPLNEIAPEQTIVQLGRTVKELLHGLHNESSAEIDAIFPLQNDLWNAWPCRSSSVRAVEPDAHGNR